ncbi:MAG: phosphomannomutase/phosphoglucomutase, partial [Neisseriaceae bacterium]|nr:phosphomannomutase/phosphoglucomutase [Neisseriaceae bacterium]
MAKEGDNHALIKELQATAQFKNAEDVITIDGLRVEYKNGFGLIRASNTTPVLVLRFEADNEESLKQIQKEFAVILKQYGIEFQAT